MFLYGGLDMFSHFLSACCWRLRSVVCDCGWGVGELLILDLIIGIFGNLKSGVDAKPPGGIWQLPILLVMCPSHANWNSLKHNKITVEMRWNEWWLGTFSMWIGHNWTWFQPDHGFDTLQKIAALKVFNLHMKLVGVLMPSTPIAWVGSGTFLAALDFEAWRHQLMSGAGGLWLIWNSHKMFEGRTWLSCEVTSDAYYLQVGRVGSFLCSFLARDVLCITWTT